MKFPPSSHGINWPTPYEDSDMTPSPTPSEGEVMLKCKHETVRFHSGGHYIQCDDCKGWWTASRMAHTSQEETDYSRSSTSDVLGGDARRATSPDTSREGER